MSESNKVSSPVQLVLEAIMEHTGNYSLDSFDLDKEIRSFKLDSLDVVEICIIIENKSGLVIEPPKNLGNIKTLRDIVNLVETYERYSTHPSS